MNKEYNLAIKLPDQDLDWELIGESSREADLAFAAACLEYSDRPGTIIELVCIDAFEPLVNGVENFTTVLSVKLLDLEAQYDGTT